MRRDIDVCPMLNEVVEDFLKPGIFRDWLSKGIGNTCMCITYG